MIDRALADRASTPYTKALRWANFASCWVTLALLAWRNGEKTGWTNSRYRREIWLETRSKEPAQFCRVEEPDEEETKEEEKIKHDHTLSPQEKEHKKFELQMQRMIEQSVDRKPFFTKKFVLECFSQLIFPYPFYEAIIFMP